MSQQATTGLRSGDIRFPANVPLSLPADVVLGELDRILNSHAFQTAEAQRNFLHFAVSQVLAGRGHILKEYLIGFEVFHRGQSFDPRVDSIVRTEARNLRLRLAKYYETEGQQDPVRIELHKGSYVPSFRVVDSAPSLLDTGLPETPVSEPEISEQPKAPPQPHSSWRRAFSGSQRQALWAVALCCLAAALGYMLHTTPHASAQAPDAHSVVVLPFTNLSADKDDEFFSDGLTDELMSSLTRLPGLKVVARTSAFQFKGQPFDIRKIGKQLGVRNVVEGSVEKYGDRLRITVQLDDTANGYQLWAETYDRELKDALALQREISGAIAGSLGMKLDDQNMAQLQLTSFNDQPPDAAAHVDYLRGLYFWAKATREGVQTAIACFQQAIAKDPSFALAYEALADAYTSLPRYTKTPTREVIPKVNAAASKALQLDGTLGEPHIDLGMAASFTYDWATADREYERGVALEPNNTMALRMYGMYLMRKGEPQRALQESLKAFEYDPVSPFLIQVIAGDYYSLRRYDDAIAWYNKCLMLDPDYGEAHRGLAMVYLQKGLYHQAVQELEMARRVIGDPWTTGQLGLAYALTGDSADAHRILDTLLKQSPPQSLSVAQVYIGLGDKDRAFEYLGKAVDEDNANLRLPTDPVYDNLRSDPRFSTLLRKMNLPVQAASTSSPPQGN